MQSFGNMIDIPGITGVTPSTLNTPITSRYGTVFDFNASWASLLYYFVIHNISGPQNTMYKCWTFRTVADQKEFWSSVKIDVVSQRYWAKHGEYLAPLAQPVYVEWLNGGPLESLAASFSADPRGRRGFFVQIYGVRNSVPCRACDRNYRRLTNRGRSPNTNPTSPVHIMSPFYGCISLPDFADGSCASCLFRIEGSTCSFYCKPDKRLSDRVMGLRATREKDATFGPRPLSLLNCPLVDSDEAAPALRAAMAVNGHLSSTFDLSADWEGTIPTSSTGRLPSSAADQTLQ